eukprot:TRINITY_DN22265_c0_g1_i1.p1 TRINITY_DN22265_c0_g1~~TRINITY_DN22265_c0_g1_i1.p1  ORF type:complete len:488 (+),score=55.06 TRINITY_DN22265_c0_g1_i1:56-1465(+)
MGCSPTKDHGLPDHVSWPFEDETRWGMVQKLNEKPAIDSFQQLEERMASYLGRSVRLKGLKAAVQGPGGMGNPSFFQDVLPVIIDHALDLQNRRDEFLPNAHLPYLKQGRRSSLRIARTLGSSLLANFLLCTFNSEHESLNSVSFESILSDCSEVEVAKLQMFLHYFERIKNTRLPGYLQVDRVVGVSLSEESWLRSERPLLSLEMAPPKVGFEQAPDLAHADFANMFIGGGVLSGGCVQEEIRFSICPELVISMLVCPCMLEEEAIQIIGAEQFSAYKGYAWSLRYNGDHVDNSGRMEDGSVNSAVLAMDALDLRGQDASLLAQMRPENMLRDLNKSLAAFTPVDEASLRNHPVLATGNWGCGAFGGSAPLKALLQWASAAQCGRQLKYFPFDLDFGPELKQLCDKSVARGVTVGALIRGLCAIRDEALAAPQPQAEVVDGTRPKLSFTGERVDPSTLLQQVDRQLFG